MLDFFLLFPYVCISLLSKIIPSFNQISTFEISDFFKITPNSTLKSRHNSKENYYNWNENHFCILPDGETLIGQNNGNLKAEDMGGKKMRVFIDQKRSQIETMIFNQNLNSLLVGERNGCVSQYGKEFSGDFKKQKEYGDIQGGKLLASDWSGDFEVVGGEKGVITLIDMNKRKVIQKGIRTAIGCVSSLQFCRVSQNEMHLAVGGLERDYSNFKTDLFDVSDLFNLGGNSKKNQLIKKMMSILKEIQKLKKNLQNQKKKIPKKNMKLNETIQQFKETIQQLTILQKELQKKTNKIKKFKKFTLQDPDNPRRV